MSVYSARFVLENTLAGWATLYTVPAGNTVVLRDIEFVNGAGTTGNLSMSVSVPGFSSALILQIQNLAAGAHDQWQGRLVMNPGDQLLANATAGNGNLTVSGYLLT